MQIVAVAAAIVMGWFRGPWWWPTLLGLALVGWAMVRMTPINAWRNEIGLEPHLMSDYLLAALLSQLVFIGGGYAVGRLAARMFRSGTPSRGQPSE